MLRQFANNIFDTLADILPSDWGKVAFHMAIRDDSSTMFFFVSGENKEKYYSDYELEQMNIFKAKEYLEVRRKITQITKEYLETFEKPWNGYTLVVQNNGQFSVDFEYESYPLGIPSGWKEKYL